MYQSKASDQWAFFQSKGIKSYIFDMQKDKLEIELNEYQKASKPNNAIIKVYLDKINSYETNIKKFESNNVVTLKDDVLRELIKKTVFSCSTDESRPLFTGALYLKVNPTTKY